MEPHNSFATRHWTFALLVVHNTACLVCDAVAALRKTWDASRFRKYCFRYQHFAELFQTTNIDGALAASVFHSGKIPIPDLKAFLRAQSIEVRV